MQREEGGPAHSECKGKASSSQSGQAVSFHALNSHLKDQSTEGRNRLTSLICERESGKVKLQLNYNLSEGPIPLPYCKQPPQLRTREVNCRFQSFPIQGMTQRGIYSLAKLQAWGTAALEEPSTPLQITHSMAMRPGGTKGFLPDSSYRLSPFP